MRILADENMSFPAIRALRSKLSGDTIRFPLAGWPGAW